MQGQLATQQAAEQTRGGPVRRAFVPKPWAGGQAEMAGELQSFGAMNSAMNSLALDSGTLGAPAYTMVVNTPAAISYTASDLVKR